MEDMLDELVAKAEFPAEVDVALFEHVAHHKDFYQIMLGKDGMASVAAQMCAYIEQFVYQHMDAKR